MTIKKHKNAADQKTLEKELEREERLARQQEEDLKEVLSTRQGRRLYWNLMGECRIFKTSMHGSSSEQVFFNEGRRSIGLKLIGDLNRICPEVYLTMVKEEHKEQEQERNLINE